MRSSLKLSLVAFSTVFALAGCGEMEPGDEFENGAAIDEADPEDELTDESEEALVAWCNDVNNWTPAWAQFEDDVILLVNQRRAAGAKCGGVTKSPVPLVTRDDRLRCAARKHSKDMSTKNFFSHTGSNGSTFTKRITSAGYVWKAAGENIAAGYSTPAAVVNGWMASTGHCNNIMNGNFKHLGVGYSYNAAATYDHYWTQDFGKQ